MRGAGVGNVNVHQKNVTKLQVPVINNMPQSQSQRDTHSSG